MCAKAQRRGRAEVRARRLWTLDFMFRVTKSSEQAGAVSPGSGHLRLGNRLRGRGDQPEIKEGQGRRECARTSPAQWAERG